MKIYGWIGRANSDRNGIALVEVEAYEIADVEAMLHLVDGDSTGHFGVSASLVATEKFPKDELDKWLKAEQNPRRARSKLSAQFGFVNASALRTQVRYYKVFVHRD